MRHTVAKVLTQDTLLSYTTGIPLSPKHHLQLTCPMNMLIYTIPKSNRLINHFSTKCKRMEYCTSRMLYFPCSTYSMYCAAYCTAVQKSWPYREEPVDVISLLSITSTHTSYFHLQICLRNQLSFGEIIPSPPMLKSSSHWRWCNTCQEEDEKVELWCGCVWVRCIFAYDPADATATHYLLLQ